MYSVQTRWDHDVQPWSSGCDACTFLQDIVKEPSTGSELLIIGDKNSCEGALEIALNIVEETEISRSEIESGEEESILPTNDGDEMDKGWDDDSQWLVDDEDEIDSEIVASSNKPSRRQHQGIGSVDDDSVVSDDSSHHGIGETAPSAGFRNCTPAELRHPAEICTLEYSPVCSCLFWIDDTGDTRTHCELQPNQCNGCAALARLKNVLEMHPTTTGFYSILHHPEVCSAVHPMAEAQGGRRRHAKRV
jgi:hypothetical protein